jgi:hypothetical protein
VNTQGPKQDSYLYLWDDAQDFRKSVRSGVGSLVWVCIVGFVLPIYIINPAFESIEQRYGPWPILGLLVGLPLIAYIWLFGAGLIGAGRNGRDG